MFQTCCPPGHVYAQDESWEPPRCSSEGAAEDVSKLFKTIKEKFG